VPASDTYIEKDAIVNEDIDRLRMSATRALFERRDVIVVASVSCIYGLGDPDAYYGMLLFLEPGMRISRDTLLQRLVELQYERNDIDFKRGSFRVRGDVVEVYPSYQEEAYRVELWATKSIPSQRSIRCWAKSRKDTPRACPSIPSRIT